MKIKILQINGNEVIAQTKIGTLKGVFRSPSVRVLKEYNVEIECEGVVKIEDIGCVNLKMPSIYSENNIACFIGFVECVEDGVLFLRLIDDLVMFEIEKEADCSLFVNRYIKIMVKYVSFYDID